MNIIEFIEDDKLIGDRSLSPAQRMALKAIYGLPLTEQELALFKQTSGLEEYVARERSEVTLILGRRAGKSDKLASNIALFEACAREHGAARGEVPVVMVVASELERQARVVFKYIEGKIDGSAVLRRMVRRRTAYEIELKSGVLIQVYPCHMARVRGASLACFIGDEVAWWKSEGRSVDKDVVEAARPGLSFAHSKLVKISTPYMMRGEIHGDFKNFYGQENDHVLVFRGSTEFFNPTFPREKLEAARDRDPVAFASEFGAEFRADLTAMYDPEVIDAAVDTDRPAELEPVSGRKYSCFVDVAGGGGKDHYAIAIGHVEVETHPELPAVRRVIVDLVRSRAPEFNPAEVTAQFAELARPYGITRVTGDKFSGDWSLHSWAEQGFTFERAEKTKSELYIELESFLQSGRLSLPPRKMLAIQLRSLVRKVRAGGRDMVDTDSGAPEDEANVAAGLAVMLGRRPLGPERGKVYWGGQFRGKREPLSQPSTEPRLIPRDAPPVGMPGPPKKRHVFFTRSRDERLSSEWVRDLVAGAHADEERCQAEEEKIRAEEAKRKK
jgi:hypothetical protein